MSNVFDAARLALLLSACLAAAADLGAATTGGCTLARIAEWPVRPGLGHVVVDGAINGHKVGVVLDTGAATSALVRAAVVRLDLGSRQSRARGMGIGGETGVDTVVVDELAIAGTVVRRNWRMLAVGEHPLGDDIAVILGEDFFRQVDLEFDLRNGVVRLFQPQSCEGRSLAYWTSSGAFEADLDVDATSTPRPEVRVDVNGRQFIALLDSGASRSVLTRSAAQSLGVTQDSAGVLPAGCFRGFGAKAIELWVGSFDSFRIGNELIRGPRLHFADLWQHSTFKDTGRAPRRTMQADMLLGADFMRAHRMLVSHSQRKIYFEHVGGTVFPEGPPRPCALTSGNDPPAKPPAKGD